MTQESVVRYEAITGYLMKFIFTVNMQLLNSIQINKMSQCEQQLQFLSLSLSLSYNLATTVCRARCNGR
jgi:hypothetical protein